MLLGQTIPETSLNKKKLKSKYYLLLFCVVSVLFPIKFILSHIPFPNNGVPLKCTFEGHHTISVEEPFTQKNGSSC